MKGVSIGGMKINNLRFADDTAVIADSEDKLQLLMTTLKDASEKHGMEINTKKNQSRICGKRVGLSLFPSDSLLFESYEQFVRKSKKSKNDCFFGHFWAKFGYVSHIPAIRI